MTKGGGGVRQKVIFVTKGGGGGGPDTPKFAWRHSCIAPNGNCEMAGLSLKGLFIIFCIVLVKVVNELYIDIRVDSEVKSYFQFFFF